INECDIEELNNGTSNQYCVNEPKDYRYFCIKRTVEAEWDSALIEKVVMVAWAIWSNRNERRHGGNFIIFNMAANKMYLALPLHTKASRVSQLEIYCSSVSADLIIMLVCSSWMYLIIKQRKLIKLKEMFF
ncbi:hypothetical protein CFP56_025823, partial [Quercus suber]